MEWFYTLGIVSYGIYMVIFITSLLYNKKLYSIEVNFKKDILAFKSVVYFCMGFSGALMICQIVNVFTVIVATIIGIIFILGLYSLSQMLKMCNDEEDEFLIGKHVMIYKKFDDHIYLGNLLEPPYKEIQCVCENSKLYPGQIKVIQFNVGTIYYLR